MANAESSELGPTLMRTPFGTIVLATVASVPAAALTVGVHSWSDLAYRIPIWALGITLTLLAATAILLISVHSTARRITSWTVGVTLTLVSGLLLIALLHTASTNPNAINNWSKTTLSSITLLITTVIDVTLAKRRVRDNSDPRLTRTRTAVRSLLIPANDTPDDICARLERIEAHLIRADHAQLTSPPAVWLGPRWIRQVAIRLNWLTSEPLAPRAEASRSRLTGAVHVSPRR